MMNYQQDMYHENSAAARSPGSQRHHHQQQGLHRQPSRQFDAYGAMPMNLYDDPMARYDRFDRLTSTLPSSPYVYDMPLPSQTWNPNGFTNSQLGNIRSTSATLKPAPSRGRVGIPTVCFFHFLFLFFFFFL